MKRTLIALALWVLLCGGVGVMQAQAQIVGRSQVEYNTGSSLGGYSATELWDLDSNYWYDPYVECYIYDQNGNYLSGSWTDGGSSWIAAAHTSAGISPGQTYYVIGEHYVIAAFQSYGCFASGCGYYWDDPYGYSFLPGSEYGGSYGFSGAGTYSYIYYDYIYLGRTGVQTQAAVVPQISGITPSGAQRGVTVEVNLTGSGFGSSPSLQVSGGGVTAQVTSATDTRVTANLTVDNGATMGNRTVTVSNGVYTSNGVNFQIGDRSPHITSVIPAQAQAGASVQVTMTGTGFGTNPQINVSTPAIQAVVNAATDTQINATFNVAAGTVPGDYTVTVTSRGLTGSGFSTTPGTTDTSNGASFGVQNSARVDIFNSSAGKITNKTVKALLGATVALEAQPGGWDSTAGGTYEWRIDNASAGTGTSLSTRFTTTGSHTVNVKLRVGNVEREATATVEAVLPTIQKDASGKLNFVAREIVPAVLNGCGQRPTAQYFALGCNSTRGITASVVAEAPADDISNYSEAKIKFVQLASAYDVRWNTNVTECLSTRNDRSADSGYMLDNSDPYDPSMVAPFTYANGALTARVSNFQDSPYTPLLANRHYIIDDKFELYAVYFVENANHDVITQKAIGLLKWSWGGEVRYDPATGTHAVAPGTVFPSTTQESTQESMRGKAIDPGNGTGIRAYPAQPIQEFQGGNYVACSASVPVAANRIDDARVFVRQQYMDILGREPDGSGWDFWTGEITRCGADSTCVTNKRADVAIAFFFADEFITQHPALAASNRGTDPYNSEFIFQCYRRYLLREPNGPPDNNWVGYNFWMDTLRNNYATMGDGAYREMVKAFSESGEYRDRFAN